MAKPRRPMGRPTKYKKEYCQGVIEYLKRGATLTEYAQEIGVDEETFQAWKKKYPEFHGSLKKAEDAAKSYYDKVLQTAALGRKIVARNKEGTEVDRTKADPILLIFLMKARFRNAYGDKLQVSDGEFDFEDESSLTADTDG